MEEVKQYFDKAYGKEHIKNVVDLKDLDSIYWLMQEYAESKQLELTAVGNRRELLIAYEKKRSETILTGDTDEEIVDQIICNL